MEEEHTCDAILPLNNEKVVRNRKHLVTEAACHGGCRRDTARGTEVPYDLELGPAAASLVVYALWLRGQPPGLAEGDVLLFFFVFLGGWGDGLLVTQTAD